MESQITSDNPAGRVEADDSVSHLHWAPPHATPAGERVSPGRRLAYGLGALTDYFFANIVQGLYTPIYVIAMKLDPFWIGVAMAITRMVGAFTDPIVGTISDNSRTRWGRRRPFIVAGTIVGALMLPFLWIVPCHSPYLQYLYIIVIVSIFWMIYSVFSVPYNALGLELTEDYDERTRVFAWKGYVQVGTMFISGWLYWLTLRPIFHNEIIGVRWLSVISGIIMIVCMAVTVRGIRERGQNASAAREEQIPVFQAIRQTMSNRSFVLIQAATLVVAFGSGIDGPIGMYLHVYYACQGNKIFASLIGGTGGTLVTVFSFLAPAITLWLSTRLGKREALLGGMAIALAGALLIIYAMAPAHPWWIVASWVLNSIGNLCIGMMLSSMMADVCDEDELVTGRRREGIYCAAQGFLTKFCQTLILVVGGMIPHLAGYTNFAMAPTRAQLELMKLILILTQSISIVMAMAMVWFYPITRERAEQTRRILDERKKAVSD